MAQGPSGLSTGALPIVTLTTTQAITSSNYLVRVNSAGGNITITFPLTTACTHDITVKRVSASNNVTYAAAGAETIEGAATQAQYGNGTSFTFRPDSANANWILI